MRHRWIGLTNWNVFIDLLFRLATNSVIVMVLLLWMIDDGMSGFSRINDFDLSLSDTNRIYRLIIMILIFSFLFLWFFMFSVFWTVLPVFILWEYRRIYKKGNDKFLNRLIDIYVLFVQLTLKHDSPWLHKWIIINSRGYCIIKIEGLACFVLEDN